MMNEICNYVIWLSDLLIENICIIKILHVFVFKAIIETLKYRNQNYNARQNVKLLIM